MGSTTWSARLSTPMATSLGGLPLRSTSGRGAESSICYAPTCASAISRPMSGAGRLPGESVKAKALPRGVTMCSWSRTSALPGAMPWASTLMPSR